MSVIIIRNLFSRVGFVTLGSIVSFISVPIISRALGPNDYGIYSYAIALAGYAFLPANWGFLAKGIRDVAKSPEGGLKIVERITPARLSLWFFGGIILLLIFPSFGSIENFKYISMAILINFGVALSIDYFYYGQKKAFLPSFSSFFGQFFFLIMLLLFEGLINSILIVLLFNFFGRLIEAVILIVPVTKKIIIQMKLFSLKKGFYLLKGNFLLGLGAKSNFFVSSLPIIIIPLFLASKDVGVYSASFKLFLVLTTLLHSINLVFSPWIVESQNKPLSVRRRMFGNLLFLYLFIGVICSSFSIVLGDEIIDILFGKSFEDSKIIFKYFCIFLMPLWPIYALLSSYLNNLERDKAYFNGTILKLIVLVVGLFLFIPLFGLKGAVFSIGLAVLIVTTYYFIHVFSMLKKKTILP
ncbi:lipopolysaccharide biosynthesis protein [Algoriphagus sediminis]|uniref:Oligosaccharide flippase family protein n=1 Tax=Algoriphagus sediminis TaxID=3057113 RepID=A0ABT7YEQ3_9BACT|nr:oligosaccharide flippase family protein [Algoriphagus sediminis]MDN3204674.1 oligosaccharide flippase family protein [Algoriphagus sediminis]